MYYRGSMLVCVEWSEVESGGQGGKGKGKQAKNWILAHEVGGVGLGRGVMFLHM